MSIYLHAISNYAPPKENERKWKDTSYMACWLDIQLRWELARVSCISYLYVGYNICLVQYFPSKLNIFSESFSLLVYKLTLFSSLRNSVTLTQQERTIDTEKQSFLYAAAMATDGPGRGVHIGEHYCVQLAAPCDGEHVGIKYGTWFILYRDQDIVIT